MFSDPNLANNELRVHGYIAAQDPDGLADPWRYGLLSFFGRTRTSVSLDQLLSDEHRVESVARDTRDGRPLVRLSVSHARARHDIWFDPAANYMVRAVRVHCLVPSWNAADCEHVVTAFREAAPGVFFPTEVRSTTTSGPDAGKLGWVATFTDIKVNAPLSADDLTVRFPPGILVTDRVRNKIFRTDARGEPTLPALNGSGRPYKLGGAADEPGEAAAPAAEPPPGPTAEEPVPASRWLLLLGLAVLVVGVAALVMRRLRQGRA